VLSVLPLDSLCIHQPEVGLIDERRGLKAMSGTLPHHAPVGDQMQLVFDQRNELLERRRISLSPPEK
jgi:hypothetical protein